MRVLIFSSNTAHPENLLAQEKFNEILSSISMVSHVNSLLFFCPILSKFAFSRHILVKSLCYLIARKFVWRSRVVPCERTENDGGSVVGKLIAAARVLKNAPKMTKELYISKCTGKHE